AVPDRCNRSIGADVLAMGSVRELDPYVVEDVVPGVCNPCTRESPRPRSGHPAETAEPLVGDLVLRDMPAAGNGSGRASRYADLLDESFPPAQRTLPTPRFDPVLDRVTGRSMLLRGHELE